MLPTEVLQETLYRFLAQTLACSDEKLLCTISCSQTKQPAQDRGVSTEAPTTETSEKETWPEQVHSPRDHDELSPCTETYLNAFHWLHSASGSFSRLLCSSSPTAMGCGKRNKSSGPVHTYKADFQETKYQMCVFAKMYVREFGNIDFYLQVVVNFEHLSRLNSVELLLPCVSFLSFLEAPSPSGQNQFDASTLQTVTLGFGLHAKVAHPSTGNGGFFRSCSRLVMS